MSTKKLSAAEIQHIIVFCDIGVIVKIERINKKTQKAIQSLKNIPFYYIRQYTEQRQINDLIIAFKLFKGALCANLFTDILTHFDQNGHLELLMLEEYKKMKEIKVIELPKSIELLHPLRQKIISISTSICYYDEFEVSDYPNLKELILDFDHNAFDFTEMFCYVEEPLKLFVLKWFSDYKLLLEIFKKRVFAERIIIQDEIFNDEDFKYLEEINGLTQCTFIIKTSSEIHEDEENFKEIVDSITTEMLGNAQDYLEKVFLCEN